MLRNYIKIAFRNLLKNKGYSAINILGLASGLAVTIFIGLWIHDELSFNKSFQNYDSVGQVELFQTFDKNRSNQTAISLPLVKEMKNFPEIKHVALTSWTSGYVLGYKDKKITKSGLYVEPSFAEVFSLKMLRGHRNGLSDVNSVMLSKSYADALFGNENPVGKIVKLDSRSDMKVTGVFEDFPNNSSWKELNLLIPFSYFSTVESWVKDSENEWGNNSFQCYVQFQPKTDFERFNAKIRNLITSKLGKEVQNYKPEPFIHPMSKWRLYNDFKDGKNVGGRITYVWLFGIIGIFVLLLACINFINLSTARSEKRAKEVGIRKAIGSFRGQLIKQFLSESVITVFFASIIAIVAVSLSISWFNNLASKQIQLPWREPVFWIVNLVFIVITSLLSGIYPSFYLSSFDPVKVLKGTYRLGKFASLPRKVLVVLQFTVSVTLIIGTIIVYEQINHAKNREVGYNQNRLIYIPMNTQQIYGADYEVVRRDMLASGVVEEVSKSNSPITEIHSNQSGINWEGKDPNVVPVLAVIRTTLNYDKTVGMVMKSGRFFTKDFSTDVQKVVINEATAELFGFKNPVGKFIEYSNNNSKLQIIGVAKNMLIESPYSPVRPTIFFLDPNQPNIYWSNYYNIKLKEGLPIEQALSKVEKIYKKYDPDGTFEYRFVDEEYNQKFASEVRIGRLATFFAVFAILISCLGLLGLASFVAEQRTKEIGIRKVLGASVLNLWKLLSSDFIVLVLISCLISSPIAYYFLNDWLEKFQYRVEISWWIFILSTVGAVLITLLTVSFQAIKAAMLNPVKSLKTE